MSDAMKQLKQLKEDIEADPNCILAKSEYYEKYGTCGDYWSCKDHTMAIVMAIIEEGIADGEIEIAGVSCSSCKHKDLHPNEHPCYTCSENKTNNYEEEG